jgi:hypothetical protein
LINSTKPHPAHGVTIDIGGRARTLRGTFAASIAIEQEFGSIFELGRQVMSRECSVERLADVLAVILADATPEEIEAHFDEVGIGGVVTEVGAVLTQMLVGFRAISREAEKSGATENPPLAAPMEAAERKVRADKGRPRGPRKANSTDACPGAISSAAPIASASCPSNFGAPLPMNSPASGAQPGHAAPEPSSVPMNGAAQPTLQSEPPSYGLFTDPAQGTA